ncbi:ROK family protein [Vallitalea sp.]|jgi:predicted NBD/HSP70 family sugar kinase|uniref:ROK family protein n=1 Tax=Vallitalea sp. TaxID=1882829 RepID=UPI0025D9FD05|nr:ROK family protein [Vallitalea sp.]MCT4685852.1 ROK family protein [Vallitalea sp.]
MEFYKYVENLTEDNKKVFNIILRFGPLTKKKIIKYTNMKLTTLNRSMTTLMNTRFIVQIGEQESTGGRKPTLFDVNPFEYYFVGIDISRTYSKVIITNLKREILFDEQFHMKQDMTPDRTVRTIKEVFNKGLNQLGIIKEKIVGGGLGTIGPLDSTLGIIFKPNNFYAKGWNNIPIKDMLEDALDMEIIIDNGANTAVYAEYLSGSLIEYSNIVYVNCGIGIRMGVIANGRIIPTINNANDAFGHMVVNYDGEPCYCGKTGCVECYASILSIVKKYVSLIKLGRATTINKNTNSITFNDIIIAAEAGEYLANEVVKFAAKILGIGLANYVTIVNPSKVILSGPVINLSDIFYNFLLKYIEKHISGNQSNIVFVKGGDYKDNAIALGAAQLFIKNKLI